MPQNLLIATRNKKKKSELESILSSWDVQLLTLDNVSGMPEIDEDGFTFEDNAIKKARTIAQLSGYITLADDSGLEVDALQGAPGVYSARFAGLEANDEANNRKLMDMLIDVDADNRTARFICVIAVAHPNGTVQTVRGGCEGHIALEPKGQEGFGYDPLFIPNGYKESFAELEAEEKNLMSHRGKALQLVKPLLQTILAAED